MTYRKAATARKDTSRTSRTIARFPCHGDETAVLLERAWGRHGEVPTPERPVIVATLDAATLIIAAKCGPSAGSVPKHANFRIPIYRPGRCQPPVPTRPGAAA